MAGLVQGGANKTAEWFARLGGSWERLQPGLRGGAEKGLAAVLAAATDVKKFVQNEIVHPHSSPDARAPPPTISAPLGAMEGASGGGGYSSFYVLAILALTLALGALLLMGNERALNEFNSLVAYVKREAPTLVAYVRREAPGWADAATKACHAVARAAYEALATAREALAPTAAATPAPAATPSATPAPAPPASAAAPPASKPDESRAPPPTSNGRASYVDLGSTRYVPATARTMMDASYVDVAAGGADADFELVSRQ